MGEHIQLPSSLGEGDRVFQILWRKSNNEEVTQLFLEQPRLDCVSLVSITLFYRQEDPSEFVGWIVNILFIHIL